MEPRPWWPGAHGASPGAHGLLTHEALLGHDQAIHSLSVLRLIQSVFCPYSKTRSHAPFMHNGAWRRSRSNTCPLVSGLALEETHHGWDGMRPQASGAFKATFRCPTFAFTGAFLTLTGYIITSEVAILSVADFLCRDKSDHIYTDTMRYLCVMSTSHCT